MEPQRRASDYYVPISLIVSSIGTIAAMVTIVTPVFETLSTLENRLTRLETRLEQLDELKLRVNEIDRECSKKIVQSVAKHD